MIEKFKGIYELKLSSEKNNESVSTINIFIIPGNEGERSLLIDCGFKDKKSLEQIDEALKSLNIKYDELDLFITHRHFDHCSLASELSKKGVKIYMSELEERHEYDCLSYKVGENSLYEQSLALYAYGINKDMSPRILRLFQDVNKKYVDNGNWFLAVSAFPYKNIAAGDDFKYGEYDFKAISLKGHTLGQMGLVDEKHKIMFSADQLIDGITPIVGTTFNGENLLLAFFESIESIRDNYRGWSILPSHGDTIYDLDKVVSKILNSYKRKIFAVSSVLEMSGNAMTTLEIAEATYNQYKIPENKGEFFLLKMIITKTASILEYLTNIHEIKMYEKDGVYFYKKI